MEDSIHFFQTEPIAKTGNVETHLFQVSATGDLNTAITEWTAFDDNVYNAFVPYYPMLTTDTADVYKVSVHTVTRSKEQPTEGVWYQDAKAATIPTRTTGPTPSTACVTPSPTC